MDKFKLSKYIETIPYNHEYILFNKINGSILLFDNDQIENVKNDYWIKVKNYTELNILNENNFFISDIKVHEMIRKNLIKKSIFNDINITISTTELCNIRCKYCYQHSWDKLEKLDKKDYMKIILDHLIESFKKISDNDLILRIHYIGGEPLLESAFILELNNHITTLCDSSKKNINVLYSIDTNSLLLTEEFIKSFPNLSVSTTLGVETDHNNLRDNTFNIVYKKIEQLREIFDGKKYKLNIRYNVHSNNINLFENFISILNRLNIKCKIDIKNIYNSTGANFHNELSDYEFENVLLDNFIPILIENGYHCDILPLYGLSLNCNRINKLNCKFYSNGENVLCDFFGKNQSLSLNNQENIDDDFNILPDICIKCYDFPYCGGMKPCDTTKCNGIYNFKDIARSRIKTYIDLL